MFEALAAPPPPPRAAAVLPVVVRRGEDVGPAEHVCLLCGTPHEKCCITPAHCPKP